MQKMCVNDTNNYYQNANVNCFKAFTDNIADKTFYTSDEKGNTWHIVSEISGKTTAIELPKYIDYSAVTHLQLKTVWRGSWESERVKGFLLRAISENGMDQQIESFYRERMTDDEILEISEELAKSLGVDLKVL